MIKKMKSVLASLLVIGAFAAPLAVPAYASAQAASDTPIQDGLCSGTELSFSGAECTNAEGSGRTLDELIRLIINIVSIVVGVVAVIMIIFGGLKYITSGGDSSNVSSAKNTIIYAIIGLVVVALAQFIVRFVLGKSLEASNAGAVLPLLVNLL